jgi:cytochrome P450
MRSDAKAPVEPVRWEDGHLVVTGFEEAALVLRGGPGWSSNPENVSSASADTGSADTTELDTLAAALVLKDPPEHTRVRSVLSHAFLPQVIERLRPRVISIVDTVLDGLEDEDEADIATDVGFVVALSVMAELFDVGVEGAELFLGQTTRLLRYLEVDRTPQDFQTTAQSAAELTQFFTPIIDKRRREPGKDFLSALVMAEGLSTNDILATCIVMLTAGGMATGALIANSTLALLREPAQIPALLANPGRAVEELLRMEGTSKVLIRTATADHDLGGHRITKGQPVLINAPAANRDLRRVPDADRLDLSREPLAHLTFGNGPHFCLGASIARVELAETLVRLFTRFPNLSLTSREPVWLSSTVFRWLQELPVRLR